MRNFFIGLFTLLFIASAWNVSAQQEQATETTVPTETPVPVRSKKRKEYNRKNVFKMNLLSVGVSTFNVGYERVIAPKVTFQLVGAVTDFTYSDLDENGNSLPTQYSGFQIQPEVRFYVSERNAPSGFYFAPYFRYRKLSIENKYTTSEYVEDENGDLIQVDNVHKGTWTSTGGGLSFGYQLLLFKQRMVVGAFAGSAFYNQKYTYKNGADRNSFPLGEGSSVSFRLGLTIGVAF